MDGRPISVASLFAASTVSSLDFIAQVTVHIPPPRPPTRAPLRVVLLAGTRYLEGPSGPPIARSRQLVRQAGSR